MPNSNYNLDIAISEFFKGTSTTRKSCDEFAHNLFGEPVVPVPLQGVSSYTVTAGRGKIVQFREHSSKLDMKLMTLAKQIHPTVVAHCGFHGPVSGTQFDGGEDGKLPLTTYSMDALPGNNYIFVRSSLVDDSSLHLNTVKGLASFFAESWLHGRCFDSSLPTVCTEESAQMFKYLAQTLPARFQRHVTEIEKILPLMQSGEYPSVLTHGDLNEMNILVDPASGKITGIVDWAEASVQPFGYALYAVDNALGYMRRDGWTHFDNAAYLREAFWTELCHLIGGLQEHTIAYIRLARVAGILIRYGTAHDRGFGSMPGVRDSTDASLRYLDALLSS